MKRFLVCILLSLIGSLAYSQNESTDEHLSHLLNLSRVQYANSKYIDATKTVTELLGYDLRARSYLKNQAINLLIDICHTTGQHLEAIELCETLLEVDTLEKDEETEIIQKLIYSYSRTGDIENLTLWNAKLATLSGITIEFLDNEAHRYLLAMDFISEVHFRLKSLHLRREEFGDDSPEYGIGLLFAANSMTRDKPNCDSSIVSKFTDAGIDMLLRHKHKNFNSLLLYAAANYREIGRYEDAEICIYSVIEEKLPEEVSVNVIAENMSAAATYWKLSREDMTSVLDNFVTWAKIKGLQKSYISSSITYAGIIEYMADNNLWSIEDLARYIDCFMGLAENEDKLQNYEQCELYLSEALTILLENDVAERDVRIKTVYHGLVEIFGKTKQYAKQLKIIEEGLEFTSNDIFKKWLFLSSDQREVYWHQNNLLFEIAPAAYWRLSPDIDVPKLYSSILLMKGLLLNSEIELKKHIEDSTNNQIADKYTKLRRINTQLDRQWSDSLVYLSEKIEREIIQESQIYCDYTHNLKLRWEDVHNKLMDNDIAIEFIDFCVPNSDSLMYAALILREGWDAPKMVTLFEAKQLEKLTLSGVSQSYNGYVGKQISQLIWGSLEEYIAKGDNVYFSPSGALHQIAIESLPTSDGRLISEKYNMYRLSSTKQLCYDHPTPRYDKAVLYGGLTFDLEEEVMVSESRSYSQSRDVYAMRGFEADSVYRAGWGILAGTKIEVKNISKTLGNNGVKYVLFEGQAGNEESFRSLSGQKNQIIHIATHGFFLPLHEARKRDYFRPIDDNQPFIDNSMHRSGLMMAGGNRAWLGEPIPEGVEDGVLTSQEIVSLDLRGADLIVLSACETGLGEVTGEGVFGLQRAFKKAGAQTLVMSLWRVSDAATELMMSEFYANLLAGKSKRESFLAAQSVVRIKFREPYYWAAFIMLD